MIDIIVIIASIILVGFFAGTETAMISCNKIRIRHIRDKGSVGAKIVCNILDNPHRMLGTTLVGTNLFVVTGSIFATHLGLRLFGVKGPVIAAIIMTPLMLLFGEIIPKTIARVFADKMAIKTSRILVVFEKILFPIIILFEFITNAVMRIVGLKQTKRDLFITKEDVELLVRQITREGVLERSEQGAIHQIFDFRYTRVGEIMVRLGDVASVDYNDDRNQILEKAKRYRFTRYPVIENKRVKGVLNIFDIFYSEHGPSKEGRRMHDWHKHIRPVKEVYANQRINQVLYKMQRNKDLMNIVVRNEKFIGIVTLQDIIDEIELI